MRHSRAPVVVGIVLGIGLAVVRLSAAETPPEAVFALGLTLLEIGVVLFLDWRASVYHGELGAWVQRRDAANEAAAAVDAEKQEVERISAQRMKLEADIRDHVTYIDEREELTHDLASREQAFVQAICDGYRHGIAENVNPLKRLSEV